MGVCQTCAAGSFCKRGSRLALWQPDSRKRERWSHAPFQNLEAKYVVRLLKSIILLPRFFPGSLSEIDFTGGLKLLQAIGNTKVLSLFLLRPVMLQYSPTFGRRE